MISVFDSDNTNFSGNGDAVLTPTECKHRQVAAGKYDLTMVHPIDPWGKWKHLVPETVIKAPVPEETIESAISGMEADVYVVSSTTATMYSGPHAPTRITYSEWNYQLEYSVGNKVTCSSATHKNYQCKKFETGSGLVQVAPYNNPDWWTPIADYTSGDPVVATFHQGDEVFLLDDSTSGWYEVTTIYGLTGYMQTSTLTYSHHLTPEETAPRTINEQLFRIKTVNVETKNNTVTVTAEHVSYDMAGILIENAKIAQMNPATALYIVQENMMIDYRGTIATNLTDDDDGTYTGEFKGQNAIYALLNPDKGIVASFEAMYRRDNWDVFVMRKMNTDRGFRLRYRKNMLGVSWNIKSDSLVTRVVPVAKAADGSDLYLDLDGVKWVDSEYIGDYPVIRMERIRVNGQVGKDDGTETATNWTEETLREEMLKKAEERFSIDKADQLMHEITVDFVMLGDTEEYKALKDMEQVLMYDKVICINEEIGLSVTAEVTEIEYDCIRRTVTAVKLANVNSYASEKNVSGFNVWNNSITADKLTDDVRNDIPAEATREAVEKSETYTNGKVSSLNTSLRNWVSNNFVPIS